MPHTLIDAPAKRGNAAARRAAVMQIAVYPLATPIIAGPGGMLTIVLLMDNNRYSHMEQLVTLGALATALAGMLVIFMAGDRIERVTGSGDHPIATPDHGTAAGRSRRQSGVERRRDLAQAALDLTPGKGRFRVPEGCRNQRRLLIWGELILWKGLPAWLTRPRSSTVPASIAARVRTILSRAASKAPTTANCSSNIASPRRSASTTAGSKQATYDTAQGFGLRAVKDEAVGYAHASDLSEAALIRAADAVRAVKGGYAGRYSEAPGRTNVRLYGDDNPLDAPGFEAKVKLLQEIDAYARAKDPRVRQVTASLGATWQVVEILRADGEVYRDIRPMVRDQRLDRGGRRRPAGNRQPRLWRARGLCALHRDAQPGAARSTMRSGRRWSISSRCPRRRARWTWCSAPAGRA